MTKLCLAQRKTEHLFHIVRLQPVFSVLPRV